MFLKERDIVMWRDIIKEINEMDVNGYTLAVSGGVDSMFLLNFFVKNCKKPFHIAHFNHNLRDISKEEEIMVKNLVHELNLQIDIGYGDAEKMRSASSLEAEARDQRWNFLKSVKKDNEYVVTAHHANDQLETAFMRFIRGCPLDNLHMKKISGYRYKPFLSISKEEIIRQAKNRHIVWMEDESNKDERYERNWLRNNIFPQIMERRNILKTVGQKINETDTDFEDDF